MGQLVPSAEELLSTALVDTPWENCGGGPIPVRLFAQLANTAALSNATGSCQVTLGSRPPRGLIEALVSRLVPLV